MSQHPFNGKRDKYVVDDSEKRLGRIYRNRSASRHCCDRLHPGCCKGRLRARKDWRCRWPRTIAVWYCQTSKVYWRSNLLHWVGTESRSREDLCEWLAAMNMMKIAALQGCDKALPRWTWRCPPGVSCLFLGIDQSSPQLSRGRRYQIVPPRISQAI